jgi:DUF1680 family protein
MGGHYLSALAIMAAATGDAQVQRRLDYVVVELKQAQDANGNGYLGGGAAWQDVARGTVNADNFSVNGEMGPLVQPAQGVCRPARCVALQRQ